jgi:sortase A
MAAQNLLVPSRHHLTGGVMSRRLAVSLSVLGLLLVAYTAVVILWRDPATDLYARWQQHRLDDALAQEFVEFRSAAVQSGTGPTVADQLFGKREAAVPVVAPDPQAVVAANASRLQRRLRLGQPLGRISIPTIDVDAVFVHGTRWAKDLSRGPGHYKETWLPGLGKTAAIAGHRTTFGAWFRDIDELERGDLIRLSLPYGTFRYRVFSHEIVESDDWSIIRNRGFDTLVLSACHPLYSSKQRWIVYARLTEVKPLDGPSYRLTRGSAVLEEGA